MQGEILTHRNMIDRKEQEISEMKSDISQRADQGYMLNKDIDNLRYEALKLNEEKAKD